MTWDAQSPARDNLTEFEALQTTPSVLDGDPRAPHSHMATAYVPHRHARAATTLRRRPRRRDTPPPSPQPPQVVDNHITGLPDDTYPKRTVCTCTLSAPGWALEQDMHPSKGKPPVNGSTDRRRGFAGRRLQRSGPGGRRQRHCASWWGVSSLRPATLHPQWCSTGPEAQPYFQGVGCPPWAKQRWCVVSTARPRQQRAGSPAPPSCCSGALPRRLEHERDDQRHEP